MRSEICSKCEDPVEIGKLCKHHYKEFALIRNANTRCLQCMETVYAEALCEKHYTELKEDRELTKCKECGDAVIEARGRCKNCYSRLRTELLKKAPLCSKCGKKVVSSAHRCNTRLKYI